MNRCTPLLFPTTHPPQGEPPCVASHSLQRIGSDCSLPWHSARWAKQFLLLARVAALTARITCLILNSTPRFFRHTGLMFLPPVSQAEAAWFDVHMAMTRHVLRRAGLV